MYRINLNEIDLFGACFAKTHLFSTHFETCGWLVQKFGRMWNDLLGLKNECISLRDRKTQQANASQTKFSVLISLCLEIVRKILVCEMRNVFRQTVLYFSVSWKQKITKYNKM